MSIGDSPCNLATVIPATAGCSNWIGAPAAWEFELDGVANGTCSGCADVNGVTRLDYFQACFWESDHIDVCQPTNFWQLSLVAAGVWSLQLRKSGGLVSQQYSAVRLPPFEGPLTMTRVFGDGDCINWPLTVKLYPVEVPSPYFNCDLGGAVVLAGVTETITGGSIVSGGAGSTATGTHPDLPGFPTGWANHSQAASSDNVWASNSMAVGQSQYLVLTNFGIDPLPEGAEITGIAVRIERHKLVISGTPIIKDFSIKLWAAGDVLGDNLADTVTDWPTVDTVAEYGGDGVAWGLDLSSLDHTDSGFGVAIATSKAGNSGLARIDYVEIEVFYQ